MENLQPRAQVSGQPVPDLLEAGSGWRRSSRQAGEGRRPGQVTRIAESNHGCDSVHELLQEAERLEREAASQRVDYYSRKLSQEDGCVLDLGCGNGYAVMGWRRFGRKAFGVDLSLYRLSRWVDEHRGPRPFALADARALPFREAAFDVVVSSGMIEHVGVDEYSAPYRIVELPDKAARRRSVIAEVARVGRASADLFIDCPNGQFPIDFFHGDGIVSFRVHRVPDSLLPSFADLRRWAAAADRGAALEPSAGRFRLQRVRRSWWGRALAGPMRLYLTCLDHLLGGGFDRWLAPLSPFLVVRLTPKPNLGRPSSESSAAAAASSTIPTQKSTRGTTATRFRSTGLS